MSEVQAIETKTKIEVEEQVVDGDVINGGEAETNGGSPEETKQPESIEIKVEGDGKPPSRRLSRFDQRIKNKNAEISKGNSENEALREENRLLRLSQQQAQTQKLEDPDEDTFEGSPEEFKAQKRAYNRQEIKLAVAGEVDEFKQQQQQDMTQASHLQRTDSSINEYYERAESMNIVNFSELEGNATDILGEDFIKTIIASTDDAHRIIASMGASLGKTAEIANMVKDNPTKAFASALRFKINSGLSGAQHSTTPDPETKIEPGEASSGEIGDKKLNALREEAGKTGDMSKLIAYKKQLREAG